MARNTVGVWPSGVSSHPPVLCISGRQVSCALHAWTNTYFKAARDLEEVSVTQIGAPIQDYSQHLCHRRAIRVRTIWWKSRCGQLQLSTPHLQASCRYQHHSIKTMLGPVWSTVQAS